MGVLIRLAHAFLALALTGWAGNLLAQPPQATEAAVKAAFLFKFVGYIEWPPAAFPLPDTPVVIGVAAADEVAGELERLVPGRSVNQRRIVVRRVKEGDDLRGLHMLFVGRANGAARSLVRVAQQNGTLAVTEGDRGLESGSSINLVTIDERIAFDVSLDAAEKSGLRISSRMLAVARRVVPRAGA